MDLVAVENAIVTRLATLFGNTLAVESYPENPVDYSLLHPGGAVLVRYQNSSYETATPNGYKKLINLRTLNFAFTVIQKSLKPSKAHQGIYTVIESIRNSLSGYTPNSLTHASVMEPTGDTFSRQENGFWEYEISFKFTYPEAEA